jgi:hypothetical protein
VPRSKGKSAGKHTTPHKVDLDSLCRTYTETNVKRLAGYATSPAVEPNIAIRAIEIMLSYGHGRPSQQVQHTGTEPDGSLGFTVRHIYEGKPKGEK